MREFETGATRNNDQTKPDFDGFLSPHMIQAFGQYMHEHRVQADGTIRDSDNWQKGIPIDAYRKSLLRHVFTAWTLGRGIPAKDHDTGEAAYLIPTLCAVIFNAQGWLHELLKDESVSEPSTSDLVDRVGEYTPGCDFDAEREGWQ